MFDLEIKTLDAQDDLRAFDCNNTFLNSFLKLRSLSEQNAKLSTTYLLRFNDDKQKQVVIGFASIKCSNTVYHDPEMSDEPQEIPSVYIQCLAIDSKWQKGKKQINAGTKLLSAIIHLIRTDISSLLGARFITMHALKDAAPWYENKFCFTKLVDESEGSETEFMYLDILR